MSFQELDLKSIRFSMARQPFSLLFKSKLNIKLLLKLSVATATIAVLGFSTSSWQSVNAFKVADSTPRSQQLHYNLALPDAKNNIVERKVETVKTDIVAANDNWRIIAIKSGDTLASIFSANGLPAVTTHNIATLNDHTKSLHYIKPGQKIHLLLDQQQSLRQMKYVYDSTKTLEIRRNQDQSFTSQIVNHKLDVLPTIFRQGIIKSSLFEAAAAGDIPESVIMDLTNIFGWDIDFSLDIRQGDQFSVVYNELYKDGIRIKSGQILAAEFINNGKLYKAVYYTNPKGDGDYYDEEGNSMRKAFLRNPVKFARISSKFNLKRWHPVLSKWRSHKGADYAAVRGTPIRASGDGKVVFAGTKGGYGKTIFIQHGGRYKTVYGHLNHYAKGIREGKKVKQGQIIGYVGSTGLATGPHLHYEFRVSGTHRNPLTVRLPEAQPVDPSYLPHFKVNTQLYLSMLQGMVGTLAANSN